MYSSIHLSALDARVIAVDDNHLAHGMYPFSNRLFSENGFFFMRVCVFFSCVHSIYRNCEFENRFGMTNDKWIHRFPRNLHRCLFTVSHICSMNIAYTLKYIYITHLHWSCRIKRGTSPNTTPQYTSRNKMYTAISLTPKFGFFAFHFHKAK